MEEDNQLDRATSLVYAARQLLGFDHGMMTPEVSAAVNTTVLNALEAANKIFKSVDTPTNTP